MAIIGILGAGQLARMLALSGLTHEHGFVFLDPSPDACSAPLGRHLHGEFDDVMQLTRLAMCADVVTCEFENVPAASIAYLAERIPVFPAAETLAIARDRLREKMLFQELGLPVAPFAAVDSPESLIDAVKCIGLPAVLKTRTLGYDGKGQIVLQRPEQLADAWERLGCVPLILEGYLEFQRELSVLGVRSRAGVTEFWPLVENVHRKGILHISRCRPSDPVETTAQDHARRLIEHLDYVGVLALELFQAGDTLFANEMAPRVHNSGHWTIEGSKTSQFENHLRAILGLPIGSTTTHGHSAMVNLIGASPDPASLLALPQTHMHLYGKTSRPGRKLGHVTICADTEVELDTSLESVLRIVNNPVRSSAG